MVYEAESGNQRWLMKAIREALGELYNQFAGLDEDALRWRPLPDEWCLKELAYHLRDAELIYQQQIELITSEHEPRLPHEALDVLPSERNYRDMPLTRALEEYESLRSESVWSLRMLAGYQWDLTGNHPYKGRISIADIVREMHEHDLEHLYQARKLREAVRLIRPGRR